jgi:hypothetical protein
MPSLVSRQCGDDIDVRNNITTHEDKWITLDQVALIKLTKCIARVGAIAILDTCYPDARRPRAVLDVLFHRFGTMNAEYEQFLNASTCQEFY